MGARKYHPTTQYAREVIRGQRIVGHSEWLACKRHLDDLKRQGTEEFPWIFDEKKANRVFDFFKYLRHIEGPLANTPIELEDFQKFDLGCIYGWVHKDTGLRRFVKASIFEARKNGKSTEVSGMALYAMAGDGEESPQVYTAAVDKGQAKIVYNYAKRMAQKSQALCKRLKINIGMITHKERGGVLMPFSKDTQNKDGFNPSFASLDEYHAHKTSDIYDVIWSAFGQRAQALFVIITTAGFNAGKSPCWNEYDYCKSVIEGKFKNERYFIMIRELDKGDDVHDPKNWIKANPLKCLSEEGKRFLQEQHDEAYSSKNPTKIRNFLTKNLNQWVYGKKENFMGEIMEKWDSLCILPDGSASEKREKFSDLTRNMTCTFGLDLSKSIDLTADCFVFSLPDGRIAVSATGFMPEAAIATHEKEDKIDYQGFAADGWLRITDGEVTDYHEIEDHLHECENNFGWSVLEVDYDPYNATHFATELAREDYTIVQIRQGVQTLSEPTKKFRDLVASEKLVHDGSPLLKMCVGNATTRTDTNGNIKLAKPEDNSTERIDLLAAIINAMSAIPRLEEANVNLIGHFTEDGWGM